MPVTGRWESLWEWEQLPRFTFSLSPVDFPKRITVPSMVSLHLTRARACTPVTVPVPDSSLGVPAAPKPQCSVGALSTRLVPSITLAFWPMLSEAALKYNLWEIPLHVQPL